MADVLHRTTKQLLLSVNTPDFAVEDWIINPELDGLYVRPSTFTVPAKYWKITGDVVTEMNAGEKAAVDGAEAPAPTGLEPLMSCTVGELPSSEGASTGETVYVTDEVGGSVQAVFDGTNWRRSTDRAVVSSS